MVELAHLFQDMEAAVVQQEDPIKHIDDKAEDTVTHVNKGNEQLDGAVDKARSARRKKWICLGIVCTYLAYIIGFLRVMFANRCQCSSLSSSWLLLSLWW